MRYDWSQGSCGRINRVMRWVLGSMAVASCPLFAHDALRDHDWTLVLPVLLITGGAGMHNVMTRKIYSVSEPEPQFKPNFAPAKPSGGVMPPDGRTPLDLDRPYPRPKGGRRKADSTCPVCGTGGTTGPLDGRVLGWRAHGSCAEWLGDWKPPAFTQGAFGPGADPGPIQVSPVMRRGTGTTYTTYVGAGETAATIGGGGGAVGSSANLTAMTEMFRNGTVSMAQFRDNVAAGFGLPGPDLGDAQALRRKACPDCGMEFTGTPADIGRSLGVHRLSGQCRQRLGSVTEQRDKPPGVALTTVQCQCGHRITSTEARAAEILDLHWRANCPMPHGCTVLR